MPYAFVYFIAPSGSALRKHHAEFPDLADYLDWLAREHPGRKLIAGEVVPTSIGPINNNAHFHSEVTRLLNEGKHVGERAVAVGVFNAWCDRMALARYGEAGTPAPLIAAPATTPKGKPRTVIVQEFIRDTDAAEVARRAWDATVAACKGQ